MKVQVGIVTRGNDINYRLAQFMWLLTRNNHYTYPEPIIVRSPYHLRDGQRLLFACLGKRDFDYAFITDADVACEVNTIDKLVEVREQAVVAPVWMCDSNTNDIHLNVRLKGDVNPARYPRLQGVDQIEAASFSCVLLSKKVFDTFRDNKEPYFEERGLKINPLQTDEIFFRKLTKMGISSWIRWDIETIHYKIVDLSTKVINNFVSEFIEYRSWDEQRLLTRVS